MKPSKRQILPAGLWVVSTPIGNSGDLAPRAAQALQEASALLCEDTRRTAQLLSVLGIARGGLERLDAHVEHGSAASGGGRLDAWIERMREGESLALVSDAGTPGISDPGAILVARAREAGICVTPLPGPSAVTALLSVAGVGETSFAFRGFFPRKAGDKRRELELASESALARVVIWLESPERILDSLDSLAKLFPMAKAVAGKEMTKQNEEFFAGSATEVFQKVSSEIETEGARGEWIFLAQFPELPAVDARESSEWVKALQCLLNARISASGAAREVSQQFGVAKNLVYERALSLSGKKREEGD